MGSCTSIYTKLDHFEALSTKLHQGRVINNDEHQTNIDSIVRLRTSSVTKKEKEHYFRITEELDLRYRTYRQIINELISAEQYSKLYDSCLKHLHDMVKVHDTYKQLSGQCPFLTSPDKLLYRINSCNLTHSFNIDKLNDDGRMIIEHYAKQIAFELNHKIENHINADRNLQMIFVHSRPIFEVYSSSYYTMRSSRIEIASRLFYKEPHVCIHCDIAGKK